MPLFGKIRAGTLTGTLAGVERWLLPAACLLCDELDRGEGG